MDDLPLKRTIIVLVSCMYDLQTYKIKTYGDENGAEREKKRKKKTANSFLSRRSLVIICRPEGLEGRVTETERVELFPPQR